MLVLWEAGRTTVFVDPFSHIYASGCKINLKLHTDISRWYYCVYNTVVHYGSCGDSCSNCRAVCPRPNIHLSNSWNARSKRHSAGTSTIRSPVFSVPFLPAGLSSRMCLIKIPLITSPLLRRLPIPRPPTMLIPSDLLGSLQSSTLLWQNKEQNKWSILIVRVPTTEDSWIYKMV